MASYLEEVFAVVFVAEELDGGGLALGAVKVVKEPRSRGVKASDHLRESIIH